MAISEARSDEERENILLCLSLDILFAAKENLWDQGTANGAVFLLLSAKFDCLMACQKSVTFSYYNVLL